MRGLLVIYWIIIFSILTDNSLFSQEKIKISKVVIDAGHGGKDPGAPGKKTQEKVITLKIALKLGEMIKKEFRDVSVYYTRDLDEFIELHQRVGLANQKKADLFISIHCNSNPSKSMQGSETYVMGLHRSEANLAIAKTENASILMEPDYEKSYDGFDPNSAESYITFSLFQNAYLEQSTDFATIVQEELTRSGLTDRGVRQAGFLVLYKTTMPSVLIEAGFLSNSEEEKFLISQSGQETIASGIFRAFKRFRMKMEGTNGAVKEEVSETGIPERSTPPPETKRKTENPVKKHVPEQEIIFSVQIATSPKEISLNSPKFAGVKKVRMYRHQGSFKYVTGELKSLDEALKLQGEIQQKGFRDAFVVAFIGDKRITATEAKKILEERSVKAPGK